MLLERLISARLLPETQKQSSIPLRDFGKILADPFPS